MKTIILIATVIAGMAILLMGTASAGMYPIAPPGSFVTLQPGNFIQSVPEQSPGLPDPNPVIGDNLSQHPGAFGIGFPPVGTFFVGIFGGPINTADPLAAIYLWETTSPFNDVAFTGPQIQLGFWDGLTFTPYGIPQAASYSGTGVLVDNLLYEITSSVTPLSDFNIFPGFPSSLNAVRIEAADMFAHNQVTAVATNVVPEPSTMLLLGSGLIGLLAYGRKKFFKKVL